MPSARCGCNGYAPRNTDALKNDQTGSFLGILRFRMVLRTTSRKNWRSTKPRRLKVSRNRVSKQLTECADSFGAPNHSPAFDKSLMSAQ